MRRAKLCIVHGALGVIAAMLSGAPAGADEWYQHYLRGKELLNEQFWAEATEELTQAIDKRPEPGVKLLTVGTNFVDYHPYLNLGIAYFNLAQYDAAVHAFDTEVRFGAIRESVSDLQNLQTFRRLAQEGLAESIDKSLEEAAELERKGQLEKALAALEKGLYLDREDGRITTSMRRLRNRLEVQGRERRGESRLRRLADDSDELLAQGEYAMASAALRQILTLKPSAATSDKLADSQMSLAQQIRSANPGRAPASLIEGFMSEAETLEKEGHHLQALASLQKVLALDPSRRDVMGKQLQLVETLARAKEEQQPPQEELKRLISQGRDLLDKGSHTQAVDVLNKALLLDPGNDAARNLLWHAFSARTLAVPRPERTQVEDPKLPPIIVLAGTANAVDEDMRPERRVSSPDFLLTGAILSDQNHIDITIEDASGSKQFVLDAASTNAPRRGNLYQYGIQHAVDLAPGADSVKVVALDPRGLAAEETVHIRYVRPWQRAPWFYAALGAGGVVLLGSALGVRAHRRRRRRQRRFNPYVAGAPVLDADLFIGREALIERILETVHNNSILLFGERRIGKTSLQHHIKKRLLSLQDPRYDFYPVYIDLEGTPEDKFFRRLGEDTFEELVAVLGDTHPSPKLTGQQEYDYHDFVQDVRRVLAALRARSSKKVKLVLLIDEVDELNKYDPRINQKLRSLFMKSLAEDLVAVVSGVGIKKHWESEGSPWYNFFEEVEVKPIDRAAAESLIRRPIQGFFRLDDGVVDRIIELTDCKPYLIQKVCMALVNRKHDAKGRVITVADVDAIGPPAEG